MWGGIRKTLRACGAKLAAPALLGSALCGATAIEAARGEEQQYDLFVVAPSLAGHLVDVAADDISVDAAEEAARSEYWIGVHLGDVPEIAKSQLKLEFGLATIDVMPDSPALQAGVQAHDILLKVNDKELREPIELVRAVNEAKDQKLKLTLLRGGKELVLDVTPGKRPPAKPEDAAARVLALSEGDMNPETAQLQRALRAWQERGAQQDGGLGLWFVRPPVWAPQELSHSFKLPELPKDVHVTIEKQGSDTAKVTVRRGDKRWITTADKLDELPDDVRDPVARMTGKVQVTVAAKVLNPGDAPTALGGGAGVPHLPPHILVPGGGVTTPGVSPAVPGGVQVERRVIVGAPQGDSAVNSKLDKILERIERLEKGTGAKAGGKSDERLEDLRRENERLRQAIDALNEAKKSPESTK